ncbi:Aste57867_25485 [Aphanomyces stellatus]|uniref:Aste57867_25485 protein n=1 Tax=Aphanomyces stellatus TaxID=120398 RepID=A0A485LTX0_9STRA|nr:hypothetical protein As57867_025406 [Aphanomyces stellatus]VFU02108.1 Aste57867_25485 [Aphanomyces stellatus]
MSFNAGAKTSLLQYPANNRICGDSTRRRMMTRNGVKPLGGKMPMDSSRSLRGDASSTSAAASTQQRPLTMPPTHDSGYPTHQSARSVRDQLPPKAASFGPPARPTSIQTQQTTTPDVAISRAPLQRANTERSMHHERQPQPTPAMPIASRQRSAPMNMTNNLSTKSSSPPMSTRHAPHLPRHMEALSLDDGSRRSKGSIVMMMEEADDDAGKNSLLDTENSSIHDWNDDVDSFNSSSGIRERAKLIRNLSRNLLETHDASKAAAAAHGPPPRTQRDVIPLLATRLSSPDDEYDSDEEEF